MRNSSQSHGNRVEARNVRKWDMGERRRREHAVLVRVGQKHWLHGPVDNTKWEFDRTAITTKGRMKRGSVFNSIHAPYFGTHKQDMQGITNVMVTCCDGHSELAIKGDNGPNESSIANTTYTIDKKDLRHILGCDVLGCSEDRYKMGCERMGGSWKNNTGPCTASQTTIRRARGSR